MQDDRILSTDVRLAAWSAWAPGLTNRADWEAWLLGRTERNAGGTDQAACLDVPAALRRRCTRLTRMVLEASLSACREAAVEPSSVRTVFCSRFGEIGSLQELLEPLARHEPMSPKGFSNSVHHTPTGYFDLVAQNRLPSRTISAGSGNLVFGHLEAAGFLRDCPTEPCLLIFADEPPPAPFDEATAAPQFPYAVAMILSAAASPDAARFRFSHSLSGAADEAVPDEPVFAFLRWFLGRENAWTLTTESGVWEWTR